MLTRKLVFLLSAGLLSVAIFIFYWFPLSSPGTFPSEETLRMELESVEVKTIQDIIYFDKRHVFIPFVTKNDSYGVSFWEWQKNEWRLSSYHTNNSAMIWKIDPKRLSKQIIAWNIQPKNDVDSIIFYFIKNRGYSWVEGRTKYQPGIQLKYEIKVDGKASFGYTRVPHAWEELAESEEEMSVSVHQMPVYYYGWSPTDRNGEHIILTYPENNGYGLGNSFTDVLMLINKENLE